jgi:hypothetical protein
LRNTLIPSKCAFYCDTMNPQYYEEAFQALISLQPTYSLDQPLSRFSTSSSSEIPSPDSPNQSTQTLSPPTRLLRTFGDDRPPPPLNVPRRRPNKLRKPLPPVPMLPSIPTPAEPQEMVYAYIRPATPVSPTHSSFSSASSDVSRSSGLPDSPRRLRRMRPLDGYQDLRTLRAKDSWEALRAEMEWGVNLYMSGKLGQ